MKYFVCTRRDDPPYLKFDCCSRDEEELLARGLGKMVDSQLVLDTGVFSEAEIPPLENGIYPVDFRDGRFTPRSQDQLNEALVAHKHAERLRYIKACDGTVAETIREGFEFDGHRFSLSQNAQLNWLRIGVRLSLGLLVDMPITTLDSCLYRLSADRAPEFFEVFCSRVDCCLLDNAKFDEK